MSDIVERLRAYRMDVDSPDVVYEAADEIEQMTEQLRSRWLDGREMSLRRMQHWLGSNPDAAVADVLERVEQQLAAVEYDRASRTRT